MKRANREVEGWPGEMERGERPGFIMIISND